MHLIVKIFHYTVKMCYNSRYHMIQLQTSRPERYLHGLFRFSIFVKGFNGIWETLSGFLVLSINKAAFSNLFYSLAQNELFEDPHDRFTEFLARALQNVSPDAKTFAAVYILFHGLLNIFLAIQLYRNKLWAYRVNIGAITIFMFYQIYRISLHHSLMLALLTIFDVTFLILTLHEYRHQKNSAIKS